jgi:hypothetical protein
MQRSGLQAGIIFSQQILQANTSSIDTARSFFNRRFFARRGITRKKTAHATEQDHPAVLTRREEWFGGQLDLDLEPEQLDTRAYA